MNSTREAELFRELRSLLAAQGSMGGMIHSSQVQQAIYMLEATHEEKNIIANLIASAIESGELKAMPYTAS